MKRGRLRDLGISVGRLKPGRNNAITDVPGVRVGYSTLCREKPHVLRTGVTVLWPQPDIYQSAVFAGCHSFNGYGEMTGALWLAEQGLLASPIALMVARDFGPTSFREHHPGGALGARLDEVDL